MSCEETGQDNSWASVFQFLELRENQVLLFRPLSMEDFAVAAWQIDGLFYPKFESMENMEEKQLFPPDQRTPEV